LKKDVHNSAVAELHNQANNLKSLITQVAPVYSGPPEPGTVPGALQHSVRVIPDSVKDYIVRVVAGGATTVRPAISSKPFDYARADEFGTVHNRAHPFFFPSYRLMKPKMIAAMKRKIRDTIRKYSAAEQ
jgi:HK97 gp10 family phage protein